MSLLFIELRDLYDQLCAHRASNVGAGDSAPCFLRQLYWPAADTSSVSVELKALWQLRLCLKIDTTKCYNTSKFAHFLTYVAVPAHALC
jgi:hypothetical protein